MTVRAEFASHLLNAEGHKETIELCELFSQTLTNIEAICGTDGADMEIVRTHLERACFHAKKSVAEKIENQDPAGLPPSAPPVETPPVEVPPAAPPSDAPPASDPVPPAPPADPGTPASDPSAPAAPAGDSSAPAADSTPPQS